jgi:hypothetical protein
MDLEFMVLDTFDALRPALIRFQSSEEAELACSYIEAQELKGLEIAGILAKYQKDGGGYEIDYYGNEAYAYGEEYYNYGAE